VLFPFYFAEYRELFQLFLEMAHGNETGGAVRVPLGIVKLVYEPTGIRSIEIAVPISNRVIAL
jgi:hypothetical protein